MVKGSEKTYGQLMQEAALLTDHQTIDDTLQPLMKQFEAIIEEAVQKNHDAGVTGKYYIHIWARKEPYANNTLHIFPQCRRTRPSPYQANDHYLWSVENGGKVTFEWCIPSKESLSYILKNPNKFDPDYVRMLRKYIKGNIDKIEDYQVKGKVI